MFINTHCNIEWKVLGLLVSTRDFEDMQAVRPAERRSHPANCARFSRGRNHQNNWQLILSVTPPPTSFLSPSFTLSLISEKPIFIPVHMERQRSSNGQRSEGETRSGILRVKQL